MVHSKRNARGLLLLHLLHHAIGIVRDLAARGAAGMPHQARDDVVLVNLCVVEAPVIPDRRADGKNDDRLAHDVSLREDAVRVMDSPPGQAVTPGRSAAWRDRAGDPARRLRACARAAAPATRRIPTGRVPPTASDPPRRAWRACWHTHFVGVPRVRAPSDTPRDARARSAPAPAIAQVLDRAGLATPATTRPVVHPTGHAIHEVA